mmetsp:Transcript_25785/g.65415  ORF Transcript_25785/g.65415 Transcript_25785/m.65415 type:complete len:267 (-) Transcript_25785:396-1196(-)
MPVASVIPQSSIVETDTAEATLPSPEPRWRVASRKAREELCMPPRMASTRLSPLQSPVNHATAYESAEPRTWNPPTASSSCGGVAARVGAIMAHPEPAKHVAIREASAGPAREATGRTAGNRRLATRPMRIGQRTTCIVVSDMARPSTATAAPPAKALVRMGVNTKAARLRMVTTHTDSATLPRARRTATEADCAPGAAASSTRPACAEGGSPSSRLNPTASAGLSRRCAATPTSTLRLPVVSSAVKSSTRSVRAVESIMSPRPAV